MIQLGDATDVSVNTPANVITECSDLILNHSKGYLTLRLAHDPMNALRATIMYSTDYPNGIFLPMGLIQYTALAFIEYVDWGNMEYRSGNMIVKAWSGFNARPLKLTVEPFSFDLSPYITYENGAEKHIEPYYSYYKQQTKITLNIPPDIADATSLWLGNAFPYERMSKMNNNIYKYVKGDTNEIKI